MSKMTVRKQVGNSWLEVSGDSHIELFEKLASLTEVFEDECCGKCKGTKLKHVIRLATSGTKTYKYPELRCQNFDCRAKLVFGQGEEGVLFPIRFKREGKEYLKDKDGKNIKKGAWGWTIYNHETGEEE